MRGFSGISSFSNLTITQDGDDAVIDLSAHGGGTIRLENVNVSDLSADNFGLKIEGTAGDDSLQGGAAAENMFGGEGDDTIDGGAGNDIVFGDAGNDTIDGGAGDDWIDGHAGDDSIDGGAGHDWIDGGAGNDTIDAGAGNDIVFGDAGNDMLEGGGGEDVFYFESNGGNDTITDFSVTDDSIDLREFSGISSFSDLTITQDGDDAVIDLSAHGGGTIRLEDVNVNDLGADDFGLKGEGTAGDDSREGGDAAENTIGLSGGKTIVGGAGDDTLEGGTGNDIIFGNAGNDTIRGGTGDDTIRGGAGDDTIDGGAGNDAILGGESDDTLTGGEGEDVFHIGGSGGNDTITDFSVKEDSIDLTDSNFSGISSFSDLTITQDGDDAIINLSAHGGGTVRLENVNFNNLSADNFRIQGQGTTGDDSLQGGDASERIFGFAGNDTIDAGAGDDTIKGGAGDDTLTGGKGKDVFDIDSNGGSDTISDFSVTDDFIDLTDSNFSGISSFADLTIIQDGDDAIIDLSAHGGGTIRLENVNVSNLSAENFGINGQGTTRDDALQGGDASENLFGLAGDDTIFGGAGDDTIDAGAGNDIIVGNAGNDALYAGAGDDYLFGNAGNDTLEGGAGNDTIDAGAGNDTIEGGVGDDYLKGNTGEDTFVYASGDGNDVITDFTDGEDTIDLAAITGITSFSDLTITQDGDDAVIDLSAHGGGKIQLEDVSTADLDADDFIFYESPVDDGNTDVM